MMTPPFLCLLAAAGIFRFLSSDAKKAFLARLAAMLPRNVMQGHLRVMVEEFPERLAGFRRCVLPFSAAHLLLNTAACACFAAAVWYFPPGGMERFDLLFVRYASVLITPIALLTDLVIFGRMLMSTFGGDAEADGAV
jgi:hypothetical protein